MFGDCETTSPSGGHDLVDRDHARQCDHGDDHARNDPDDAARAAWNRRIGDRRRGPLELEYGRCRRIARFGPAGGVRKLMAERSPRHAGVGLWRMRESCIVNPVALAMTDAVGRRGRP